MNENASLPNEEIQQTDVLIVGAGISGIGAACRLRKHCPSKHFLVVDGRKAIGGTWDLFRYPGIRSDSDMYTLGYPFRPWTGKDAIADGDKIKTYLQETAEEYAIKENILFSHTVREAVWNSKIGRWMVRCTTPEGETQILCRFLFLGCGYYDYQSGYSPSFPGQPLFQGEIIHPQKWKDNISYENKRIVIIGSGATAITMLPVLAKKAAHITMLQRSPSYIAVMPKQDPLHRVFENIIPSSILSSIIRFKAVCMQQTLYRWTRLFPNATKRILHRQIRSQLGADFPLEHFTPSYDPWDQRLCISPDGDFFQALKDRKASIVTDHIERFTENGILLRSGKTLPCDMIITATGLNLKVFGGIQISVDTQSIQPSQTTSYQGMMCTHIPNLIYCFGYVNASWTLRSDLVAKYLCHILRYMERHNYTHCIPMLKTDQEQGEPFSQFQPGYIRRSLHLLPRSGERSPWIYQSDYLKDLWQLGASPNRFNGLSFYP
ncbi:MAG: NAD(P)/FAD-dependent oxidoreductase [Myxococcota bacterium]|nr:NAD(P)/FAD-dependent oxidoreductase [Myxococcota bacterium]